MSLTWDARFNSIGISVDGSGSFGSLSLFGEAGPDRVRVEWGATGPLGERDTEQFLPELDGTFTMPADGRLFADGEYLIKAIGIDDSTNQRVSKLLNAFFDVNGTLGIEHVGNGRDDLMSGGAGDDTFYGQGGNDWVFGGLGADLLHGGDGEDFLGGGGDTAADTLNGGEGNDLLAGDEGDDLLLGGGGDDFVFAGAGNDTALGHGGDDFVAGEAGDDLLSAAEGNDTLYGDFTPGTEAEGAGNDTLAGGDGSDLLDGGDGNDMLHGEAGDDILAGGGGDDTLNAGDGADELLLGNGGNDRLTADAGFARFIGGAGNDTMVTIADGEADWFVYDDIGDGYDRIVGFESDFDAILFLGIDEAHVGAGRFVADVAAITGGGTWIIYDALGRLWVDTNGIGAGGLNTVAILLGAPTLAYDNFLFAAAG